MSPRRWAVVALLWCATTAGADASFDKLYVSIRTDPSFKVRLQAIRVLSKQLKNGAALEPQVFSVLGDAALRDEEHVVRGTACFALGELGDPRGKAALEVAVKDANPFVRAQAGDALRLLARTAPPVEVAGVVGGSLVFALDASPGIEAPPEAFEVLKKYLGEELRAQGASKFQIVETEGAPGFRFGGSIAELSTLSDGTGTTKMTVVVKIAITTQPGNHLRHVMTAKASAASKASGAGLNGLRNKLLQAAAGRAVKDSLAAVAPE